MMCISKMIEEDDEMGNWQGVEFGKKYLSFLPTCNCMNKNIIFGEGQKLCCGCPTIDLEIFCRVSVSYCVLSFRGELLAGRAGMFLSCRCFLCCGSLLFLFKIPLLKSSFLHDPKCRCPSAEGVPLQSLSSLCVSCYYFFISSTLVELYLNGLPFFFSFLSFI